MALEFNPELHEYQLDEVVLPSVTQIIAPLQDFSGIDPETLKNKADFGKKIHKMCALYNEDRLDESSLSTIQIMYLKQYTLWLEEMKFSTTIISETPLASKKYGFAGTPDFFILKDLIVDIKTRPFNPVTDPIQLAEYDILVQENYGKSKMNHYVLSLSHDVYKFQKCGDKQAKNKFLYLLDHHKKQIEFNQNIKLWRQK